jgi:hypothetical protein
MSRDDISWNAITSVIRVAILRVRFHGSIKVGFDAQIGPGCRIVIAKGGMIRLRGVTLARGYARGFIWSGA